MKRVRAEFPFEAYWLYKIWHKKEGRWQANLIAIENTKQRTTLSYARYLMSVHSKRILNKDEQVDHLNNDKADDRLENLQILSSAENKKKQEDFYSSSHPKYIQLKCGCCGKIFDSLLKNYTFNLKAGRSIFYCSRPCVYMKNGRVANIGLRTELIPQYSTV